VYFLRGKTAIEVVSVFQEFKARVEKQFPDWPIVRFRCDNGRGNMITVYSVAFYEFPVSPSNLLLHILSTRMESARG